MMIEIAIGALVLAIWLITLFFERAIGLSMILFVAPFICFLINLLEKNNRVKNKRAKLFLIPIILLSATYGIFNNGFFNTLNIFIIPILIVIMLIQLFNGKFLIDFSLIRKTFKGFFIPAGFFGNFYDKLVIENKEKFNVEKNANKNKNAKKIIKAVLITLPIVLVILALLSSADQLFSNIFKTMFDTIGKLFETIRMLTVLARILFIALAFLHCASVFYYYVSEYKAQNVIKEKQKKINDNFTMKMILVSLNIIYLIFCFIQIKSLFFKNKEIN